MKKNFWEGHVTPGRIFGNVYFVGTRPASTHVIDTEEGLIVIDPGYPEALGEVLANMRAVGLDPMKTRVILCSHGHYDHAGAVLALREMTGAKVYLGRGDLDMVEKGVNTWVEELGTEYHEHFTPDVLLDDGDHVTLGKTDILCLATPGHTAGTLSFFFDVTDGERTVRAGMHGGVGINTLSEGYIKEKRLPADMREKFLSGLGRLKSERVELFLGNHVHNNNTETKLEKVAKGDKNAFITPEEWIPFLESREKALGALMEAEAREAETVRIIEQSKVVMIVRGVALDALIPLAEAMYRGGIRAMECTYDATGKVPDEAIAEAIGALAKHFEGRMVIGAGTVIRESQVELTAKHGGRFIVSPDMNEAIIRKTKAYHLASLPGALTPTEAAAAHRAGADFVKLFPISTLGAPYLKAVRAPLSHIRFIAVGGVRLEKMADYLAAGAKGFGIGVTDEDKQAIKEKNFAFVEERCRRYMQAAQGK